MNSRITVNERPLQHSQPWGFAFIKNGGLIRSRSKTRQCPPSGRPTTPQILCGKKCGKILRCTSFTIQTPFNADQRAEPEKIGSFGLTRVGPQRFGPFPLCFSWFAVPSLRGPRRGPRWATARRAVGRLFSAVLRAVPVWATVGHANRKHEIARRATSSPRPRRWVAASPSFSYVSAPPSPPPLCVGHGGPRSAIKNVL